jgi:hypothetical protein
MLCLRVLMGEGVDFDGAAWRGPSDEIKLTLVLGALR